MCIPTIRVYIGVTIVRRQDENDDDLLQKDRFGIEDFYFLFLINRRRLDDVLRRRLQPRRRHGGGLTKPNHVPHRRAQRPRIGNITTVRRFVRVFIQTYIYTIIRIILYLYYPRADALLAECLCGLLLLFSERRQTI